MKKIHTSSRRGRGGRRFNPRVVPPFVTWRSFAIKTEAQFSYLGLRPPQWHGGDR